MLLIFYSLQVIVSRPVQISQRVLKAVFCTHAQLGVLIDENFGSISYRAVAFSLLPSSSPESRKVWEENEHLLSTRDGLGLKERSIFHIHTHTLALSLGVSCPKKSKEQKQEFWGIG